MDVWALLGPQYHPKMELGGSSWYQLVPQGCGQVIGVIRAMLLCFLDVFMTPKGPLPPFVRYFGQKSHCVLCGSAKTLTICPSDAQGLRFTPDEL